MNWALAFRQLGWDVWLTEHLGAGDLSDPDSQGVCRQQRFWTGTMREFGFEDRECLLIDGAARSFQAMREFAAEADLFLNYSGQFHRLDLLPPALPKAYLDLDPAFTQLWAETCHVDMNFHGHDAFLTIGMNVNGETARFPKAAREWIPVRPPVAAATWRAMLDVHAPAPLPADDAPWTTVGHWYGYNDLPWEGRMYGGKRHSFLAMLDLPARSRKRVAVATDLQPEWGDDTARFEQGGWEFVPAESVCANVPAYLRFLRQSRGEVGIAKQGYLVARSGWISDRSLVYLSLGRPVILQDTGWPEILPVRHGLLPFRDGETAAAAMRTVDDDFPAHAAAAWRLADSTFSPAQTIVPMLERLGVA